MLTINKLEDLAKEQGNPGYGIFSSHPEPEERLKRVMKQIKALKVHPEITLNEDNTARVHEGDWGFNITQTVGNDRPEYRAYMLAGGLYCVRERDKGHIDPYRFIAVSYTHLGRALQQRRPTGQSAPADDAVA